MAPLIGTSLMAISAFYHHKRSVDQVLQCIIEICRKPPCSAGDHCVEVDNEAKEEEEKEEEAEAEEAQDDDGGYGSDGKMEVDQKFWSRCLSRSLDENMLRCYRISSSMPNVTSRNDWPQITCKP